MKRQLARLLGVFLLVSGATMAQKAPVADVPSTRDDIMHLFRVINVRDQMRQTMDAMMLQMKQMSHDALRKRHPDITGEELARLDASSEEMVKSFPVEGMLEDMVPVYQKHLSKADVNAMVKFYSGPTGRKLLRQQAVMTTEAMQAVYNRLQTSMDESMQRIEEMVKEDAKKKDNQTPPEKK
jgi:hypothetical protein